MLRGVILGAALALAVAATPAQADPTFDAYQALCVKTRADAKSVLALADAQGWMPVPDVMLASVGKTGIDGAAGRMKTDARAMNMLIVGGQTRTIEGERVNLRMCAVAVAPPGDDTALKAQVAGWTAVPPDRRLSKGSQHAWVFTQEAAGHQAVGRPSDSEAKALLTSDRLNFVFLRSDPKLLMLAFAVPSK